jgi:hypothetical protein
MRTIIVAALVVLFTGTAHATPGQCQRTIIREAALYNRKVLKLRQSCEEKNIGRPVPLDCSEGGLIVMFQLEGLRAKFRKHIEKECRHETLASIGWTSCPNFEGACGGAIVDLTGVEDCVFCINDAAVEQAIALYYAALTPDPDAHLRLCQKAIGKEGYGFFAKKTKAMARCELRDFSGDIAGPCPGDPKTDQTIARASAKLEARICNRCGGDDHICGSGDDRTPTEIGFTAACPNVTVPGGPSCANPAVDTLTELVDCVNCLTEFKVDCLDALAAPLVKAYPPECL